jgi:VWFA-related protein
MRRSIVAGLWLCTALGFSSVNAQQPAPQPLVEKIDVRVVNVDVTVTDRSGKPVRGLTRDDFELTEDGKVQSITHFDAIRKSEEGVALAQAPQERFKRKVLVLVDNMNTSMHGRNEALRNLEKFIDTDFAGDYEWSIAMVDRRVRLLLPMTSDKPRIHDIVADIAHRGTSKEVTAAFDRDVKSVQAFGDVSATEPSNDPKVAFREGVNQYEQSMFAQQSFQAISEAARAFANVGGKKIILLVTGRLPFLNSSLINTYKIGGLTADRDEQRSFDPASKNFDRVARYNAQATTMRDLLVAEANASNASFYIIGAEGLQVADMSPGTQGASGSTLPDTSDMYWMAKSTGGRFMPGNRIGESLREFDETSANFYSLGYTPADEGSKYHRIKVRLKEPRGYRLQYREGFAEIADDVQLERTLHSYLGVTMQNATLPVRVDAQPVRYSKDQKMGILPFELSVPMARLQYIEQTEGAKARVHIYVSVFDHEDRFVTLARYVQDVDLKANEQPSGRMVVNFPGVSLKKGDYRLVVAVRDEVAESLGVSVQRVKL